MPTRVEQLPESLWDISFVIPEHAALIKREWTKEDFIDLGGGVKMLQYSEVLKNKDLFYKILQTVIPDGALIDGLWQRLEAAKREESSLWP